VRVFSKRILGVITAFTGQWPHSVPFRPGGATCPVGAEQIRAAWAAVDEFAAWYAPTILGGPLDQWAEVATAGDLEAWLDQHPRSVIGLFSRFATAAAGLHRAGRGSGNLLSGGLYRDPGCPARPLIRGGVLAGGHRHQFDHQLGPRTYPVLLVHRRRPLAPLADGGHTRPQPGGVLQLGHRPALRRR
jgi:hydrogenase large subunit